MADHLTLPPPRPLDSRRRRPGAPPDPDRAAPVPGIHGGKLRGDLAAALSARTRVVIEGVDPRQVFKIRATTRLPDAALRPRGLFLLGDTEDWTYFVVPTEHDASTVQADLALYEGGQARKVLLDFFGHIDSIEPYGPSDRRGPGIPEDLTTVSDMTVDVILWPSPDGNEAGRRIRDVTRVLDEYGGERLSSDERPLTTMVRARVQRETLASLLELMVVEEVRAPLAPFLEPSDWIAATMDGLEVPDPIDILIGIVDDGVHSGHPLLANVVVTELSVPETHAWAVPSAHGTMVSGLAAYGDFETALRDGGSLPAPARLAIARVLEPAANGKGTHFPTDAPAHLICEAAIRALHAQGARIINLSITDPDAYSGPHVGLWTETLDQLVRELNIVLVISAGNRALFADGTIGETGHIHRDYPTYALDPEARVAEPAVAANAVAVGSIARSAVAATASGASRPKDLAVAGVNELSPFSRTGPGVHGTRQHGTIKPDFVHYGGNAVWSELGRVVDRDPGASSVSLTTANGRLFGVGSGTSFAAPRVARCAAEILHRYPGISSNLVRALLGMSAEIPAEAAVQFDDPAERHRAFGYGMPRQDRSTESIASRVVMLHEGEVAVDTAIIHPIPVPSEFATGRADRTITVAVAFDPPVRRQRREYIAGRIGMDFYRAMNLEAVEELMRKQEANANLALPTDRRRVASKFAPGAQLCEASTLQVRRWQATAANSLLPDDGDTYYVVVKHYREDWAGALADPYESQRYALAVQLEDRTRTEVDLYNLARQQIQQVARVRLP